RAARRASSSPVRDARTARGDDGRAAHRPAADRRPTHSPGARRRRRLAGRGPLRDCAADPAPRGAAAGGARTRPWGSSSPRSRGASPGAGVVATGDPYAPHAEDRGWPPPALNHEIVDPATGIVYYVDLAYPQQRIAIEYD